tara:strand:- start:3 stop:566 length:564 start_codon:yes stop_codon:yes gene_type:complete
MSKLLFFAGSSRKESVNSKLAQSAAELGQSFEPGRISVTLVDLADFDAPNVDGASATTAEVPEQVIKFRELLRAHDGFFIGSDEYTGAYSSILRNLIGWLVLTSGSDDTAFKSKPVAICGASSRGVGSVRGHPALQQLFVTLGANVISQHIRLGTGASAFQQDGKLTESVKRQLLDNAIPKLLSAVG